jgi:hypothetical protein
VISGFRKADDVPDVSYVVKSSFQSFDLGGVRPLDSVIGGCRKTGNVPDVFYVVESSFRSS